MKGRSEMGVQLFNMNVQVHIKESSILTFEKVGKKCY